MTCVPSLYDYDALPKLLWFFGGALSVELIRHLFRLWKLKSANKIHEVIYHIFIKLYLHYVCL